METFLIYLTYGVLIFNVGALWLRSISSIKPWKLLLGFLAILGLVSKVANPSGILALALFYGLVAILHKLQTKKEINQYYPASFSKYYYKYKLLILILLVLAATFIYGVALELHFVPGFNNYLVWHKVKITNDAIPFTLYLNFDKTIVGIIIIGTLLKPATKVTQWRIILKENLIWAPITIAILLACSFSLGYIKFAPKLPINLWIWVISNLFFTCVAEEALFRGLLQQSLSNLPFKHIKIIALPLSAILFGLMHYSGGIKYIFLATIAGALYGLIYKKTAKIEASIFTHFLLNLTHILLFTYPALG